MSFNIVAATPFPSPPGTPPREPWEVRAMDFSLPPASLDELAELGLTLETFIEKFCFTQQFKEETP